MDRNEDAFRRRRVRASWAILGAAMVLKMGFVGWVEWLAWCMLAVSRAMASWANQPAPPPFSSGQIFARSLQVGCLFGLFAGVVGIVVAALQRLALGRRFTGAVFWDPLRGWIARSGAAAALASFGAVFAITAWNHIDGEPSIAGAVIELLVETMAEVGAIVSVQRRLLGQAARARG